MKPADKKRLKAAWEKALKISPQADQPVRGGAFDNDGKPLTWRKAIEESLKSGELYDAYDNAIKSGQTTLDQAIKAISRNLKPAK